MMVLKVVINGTEIKFFSSPDNHGFASATGFFTKNFSYQSLVLQYLNVTGLNEPVFMQQSTPLLSSTWAIPEMQLRYASDMAFQVGRVGFVFYSALLSSALGPLKTFPVFMIFFGVIGAISQAYLLIQLFYISQKVLSIESKRLSVSTESLLSVALALTSWITLFVLEGSLNQLWLIVCIQFQLLQLMRFLVDEKSSTRNAMYFNLAICPIFMSVIYPHGSLLLVILSMPIFALYVLQKRWSIKQRILKLFIAASTTLFCIPFTYYLLTGSFSQLMISFIGGVTGMPYSIGYSNLFEYLPFIPPLFLALPGRGYFNLIDSKLIASISIVTFLLLIIFLLYREKNKRMVVLLLFLVPLGLLLITLFGVLKEPFHPYNFMRYCALFASIGLPILMAPLVAFKYQLISASLLKNIRPVLIGVLIFSIINFTIFTNLFNRHARPFNTISSIEDIKDFDLENSLLVTEDWDHRMLSFNLVSRNNYLTSWSNPVFPAKMFKENKVKVYGVTFDSNEVAKFILLGHLIIDKDIAGKMGINQLIGLPSFIPLN
jgi:hypothetical protein